MLLEFVGFSLTSSSCAPSQASPRAGAAVEDGPGTGDDGGSVQYVCAGIPRKYMALHVPAYGLCGSKVCVSGQQADIQVGFPKYMGFNSSTKW